MLHGTQGDGGRCIEGLWLTGTPVVTTGDGAVGIVEMLFCTSLVALVGTGDRPNSSTRRLQIVNTKVSLSASFSILGR